MARRSPTGCPLAVLDGFVDCSYYAAAWISHHPGLVGFDTARGVAGRLGYGAKMGAAGHWQRRHCDVGVVSWFVGCSIE